MSKRALKTAIKRAGGERALADAIGTTPQLVRYWVNYAKKGATPTFVPKIEALTGVPRHALRPDIWPRPAA